MAGAAAERRACMARLKEKRGQQKSVDGKEALRIDPSNATALFSLLDKNGDGQVDIVEFVEGMQKMRNEVIKANPAKTSLSACEEDALSHMESLRMGCAQQGSQSTQDILSPEEKLMAAGDAACVQQISQRQIRMQGLRTRRAARVQSEEPPASRNKVPSMVGARSIETETSEQMSPQHIVSHEQDSNTKSGRRSLSAQPLVNMDNVALQNRQSGDASSVDASTRSTEHNEINRENRRARVEAMRLRCVEREQARKMKISTEEPVASHSADLGEIQGHTAIIDGIPRGDGNVEQCRSRSAAQRRMDQIRLSRAARAEERTQLQQEEAAAYQNQAHANRLPPRPPRRSARGVEQTLPCAPSESMVCGGSKSACEGSEGGCSVGGRGRGKLVDRSSDGGEGTVMDSSSGRVEASFRGRNSVECSTSNGDYCEQGSKQSSANSTHAGRSCRSSCRARSSEVGERKTLEPVLRAAVSISPRASSGSALRRHPPPPLCFMDDDVIEIDASMALPKCEPHVETCPGASLGAVPQYQCTSHATVGPAGQETAILCTEQPQPDSKMASSSIHDPGGQACRESAAMDHKEAELHGASLCLSVHSEVHCASSSVSNVDTMQGLEKQDFGHTSPEASTDLHQITADTTMEAPVERGLNYVGVDETDKEKACRESAAMDHKEAELHGASLCLSEHSKVQCASSSVSNVDTMQGLDKQDFGHAGPESSTDLHQITAENTMEPPMERGLNYVGVDEPDKEKEHIELDTISNQSQDAGHNASTSGIACVESMASAGDLAPSCKMFSSTPKRHVSWADLHGTHGTDGTSEQTEVEGVTKLNRHEQEEVVTRFATSNSGSCNASASERRERLAQIRARREARIAEEPSSTGSTDVHTERGHLNTAQKKNEQKQPNPEKVQACTESQEIVWSFAMHSAESNGKSAVSDLKSPDASVVQVRSPTSGQSSVYHQNDESAENDTRYADVVTNMSYEEFWHWQRDAKQTESSLTLAHSTHTALPAPEDASSLHAVPCLQKSPELLDRKDRMHRIQELRHARGATPMPVLPEATLTKFESDNVSTICEDSFLYESLGLQSTSSKHYERQIQTKGLECKVMTIPGGAYGESDGDNAHAGCNSDNFLEGDDIVPFKKVVVLNSETMQQRTDFNRAEPEPEMQVENDQLQTRESYYMPSARFQQSKSAPIHPGLIPTKESVQDIKSRWMKFQNEGVTQKTHQEDVQDFQTKWESACGFQQVNSELESLTAPLGLAFHFAVPEDAVTSPQQASKLNSIVDLTCDGDLGSKLPSAVIGGGHGYAKHYDNNAPFSSDCSHQIDKTISLQMPLATHKEHGASPTAQTHAGTKAPSVVPLPPLALTGTSRMAACGVSNITLSSSRQRDNCVHQ